MIELIESFFRTLYNVPEVIRWGGLTVLILIVFAETGLMIGFFLPGVLLSASLALLLPARAHQAFLFDAAKDRVHGPARQVGGVHDVEPVMPARHECFQHQRRLIRHVTSTSPKPGARSPECVGCYLCRIR